jgi:hypothetical protein
MLNGVEEKGDDLNCDFGGIVDHHCLDFLFII